MLRHMHAHAYLEDLLKTQGGLRREAVLPERVWHETQHDAQHDTSPESQHETQHDIRHDTHHDTQH